MTNVLNDEMAVRENEWRQRADDGDIAAMYNLGLLLEERGAWGEAARWYRRAALDGDVDAMFNLAVLLEDRNEPTEAKRWYRRAAEAGDDEARTSLLALESHDQSVGSEAPRGPAAHPSAWAGDSPHPPGWWRAADGNWYPPEPPPPVTQAPEQGAEDRAVAHGEVQGEYRKSFATEERAADSAHSANPDLAQHWEAPNAAWRVPQRTKADNKRTRIALVVGGAITAVVVAAAIAVAASSATGGSSSASSGSTSSNGSVVTQPSQPFPSQSNPYYQDGWNAGIQGVNDGNIVSVGDPNSTATQASNSAVDYCAGLAAQAYGATPAGESGYRGCVNAAASQLTSSSST